jgi:HlyD family secretion protein
VISSATSSVSGGTTLLQMADLSRVRIRALVSETDIGSLHPGQSASVSVDAYPQRPFRGTVEKIEPQAVVQQSVTMFPVLISISNEDGILLPGMNGEVTVVVDERTGVPAVPLDAVRTMRELPTVAKSMGLDADSLQAVLRQMRAERGAAVAGTGGGWGGGGAGRGRDSLRVAADGQGGRTGRGGRGGRGGGGGGGGGWRNRAGGAGGGAGAGGARAAAQTMIAIVKVEKRIELRIVRVGLSDFDYGEVLSGLKEGDEVAMLSVAQIQAQRAENINQIRERVSGMGGLGGGTGRSGGGRSGGGASGGGSSGGGRGGPGGGP